MWREERDDVMREERDGVTREVCVEGGVLKVRDSVMSEDGVMREM